MKKELTCLGLTLALLASTAGAEFSDITDPNTAQAAASLDALDIMDGVGNNLFEPDRALTRAEFTKLAAGSLGLTDVTGYKSYTLFPDVLYTHWASGYIAAMIKDPDISKKQVIRGNADGTFEPERTVTYGEVCTMLLRMLDYGPSDVGPIWPDDYVAKAQSLGLTKGITGKTPSSNVTRADAAILLRNTLRTPAKGGDKLYLALSGGTPIENAILLATPATDPSLSAGQLRFYEGGEIVTRLSAGVLDSALVGARGVILFDKTNTARVRSFLPEDSERMTYTVIRSERQQLVTDAGSISVGRKVPVVVAGELHDYIEAWFDILPGDKVNLYYDKDHNLELISVDASFIAGETYVWGVDECVIPDSWRIERNGAAINKADLRQYDVVTLRPSTQTALVSNARITGFYQEATPSFRFPEKIKVLNTEFAVSEKAAPTFDQLQLGQRITLLFDVNGHVRAAVPSTDASGQMTGIMTKYSKTEVTVRLFNGITITGPLNKELKDAVVGQMVRVFQSSDGTLNVLSEDKTDRKYGSWIVSRGVLGDRPVAPDVQIFEQVADNAPLNQLDITEVPFETIDSKYIRTAITDPAGTVTAIILDDVTGESWVWGAVEGASVIDQSKSSYDEQGNLVYAVYDYRVKITTLEDGKSVTHEILLEDQVEDLVGKPTPLGLPKAALDNQARLTLASKKPTRVDTVAVTAFDGYTGVRTAKGYYEIDEDCPVYSQRTGQCMTLRQAKGDYDSFVLYSDRSADQGGKIRMIVVN